MLLQTQSFAEKWLEFWTEAFADSGAILMVLCGMMTLIWFFYEGVRRGFIKPKNEEWERDRVSRILKGIIYLGILLGIIVIISAIVIIFRDIPPSYAYRDNIGNHYDKLTSFSLLFFGLLMFIKPLEDVPLATIVGLLIGGLVALVLSVVLNAYFPNAAANPNTKWVILAIFLFVTTAIGMMLKVWVDGIEFLAKLLSWPPVALILSTFCLVQGFSLWIAGKTLILI